MKKVAINGFGRIGRATLKIIMDTPDMVVVAVNDLLSSENAGGDYFSLEFNFLGKGYIH